MTGCLRQTFAMPPHRQDRAHIGRLIKPPAFSEADVHQKGGRPAWVVESGHSSEQPERGMSPLPTFYSITSSARARSDGGMLRSSALAVL